MSQAEVDNAIARAQSVASHAAAPANAVVQAAVNTMSTAALPQGRARTLADKLDDAPLSSEFFVGVDKNGILIDKDDSVYFDVLELTARLMDFKFVYAAKYKSAGGTAYLKSIDRIRESRSNKSWAAALAEAQRIDPSFNGRDYDSTDFVVTLAKEYRTKTKTFPVGTRLGHSTSTTGDKTVTAWLSEMFAKVKSGDITMETEVKVALSFLKKEKGQNKWGVLVPVTIN